MSQNTYYAPITRTVQVGLSAESLVEGLTISRYLECHALSTNPGVVSIFPRYEVAANGYQLEAGEEVTVDTRDDPTLWQMSASLPGCTITYIGRAGINFMHD